MTIFPLLYVVTVALHAGALYWGLRAWKRGESVFTNSNPLDFFKCSIEREFWAVCMGVTGNLSFIFVKPFYIAEYSAEATGWQEPFWVYGHLAIALVLLIWHHKAFKDIDKYIKGECYE